ISGSRRNAFQRRTQRGIFHPEADYMLDRPPYFRADAVEVNICRHVLYLPCRMTDPVLGPKQTVLLARYGQEYDRATRVRGVAGNRFGNSSNFTNTERIVCRPRINAAFRAYPVSVIMGGINDSLLFERRIRALNPPDYVAAGPVVLFY